MKEIPYRHVELGRKAGPRIRDLKAAIKNADLEGASSLSASIIADLRAAGDDGLIARSPEAAEAARTLETIVSAISDNRRALLPFRERFPDLARVVKDPWSTAVVDPSAGAFVDALPKKKRASVRVDPDLTVAIATDGAVGRGGIEEDDLVFRYSRHEVARIKGPADKLMLLSEIATGIGKLMRDDLLKIELPRDVKAFRSGVESAGGEVATLLSDGRILVEVAERLVCALYGISSDLTDEVVAHAVARASVVPADE